MQELFQNLFSPPRHLILLIAALWIGLVVAEKRSVRHGVKIADLNHLIFVGIIVFVLAGRISFAIQNFSAFARSPLGLISINPDLFDPMGGLLGSLLGAMIVVQKRNLDFWSTLDSLTPFLSVLAIGTGLSQLAAGTGFGRPTQLPWAIELWSANRHPVQIYNTTASLTIFYLMWCVFSPHRPGLLFLTFSALTLSARVFLLGFRGDMTSTTYGFYPQQILAWFLLAACMIMIEQRLDPKSHG